MRRRLYNLFGLPQVPENELIRDEVEPAKVVEEGDSLQKGLKLEVISEQII